MDRFLRSGPFHCLFWWGLEGWPLVFGFIFQLNRAVDLFGWGVACRAFQLFFFKRDEERVAFLLGCALFGERGILYLVYRCKCVVWTPCAWFMLLGKSTSWFRLLVIVSLEPSSWSRNFNARVLGCGDWYWKDLLDCWVLLLMLVKEVVVDVVVVYYIRYWLGC